MFVNKSFSIVYTISLTLFVKGREKVQFNLSAGNSVQDLALNFFRNLTRKEGEALKNLYKYDFEMFGYDAEIYLNATQS